MAVKEDEFILEELLSNSNLEIGCQIYSFRMKAEAAASFLPSSSCFGETRSQQNALFKIGETFAEETSEGK